jgi:DNA-binding CsgD family transcriptional regulator
VIPADEALAVLGLDGAETAAYELLVDRPSATLADLAPAWPRPEPLDGTLASIVDKGLATALPGPVTRYTANSPGMALRALLREHEERLEAARRHLSLLEAVYQDRAARRDPATIVEVVTGRHAVRQRLVQIRRTVRTAVRCLDRPPYLDDDRDEGAAELLRRGSGRDAQAGGRAIVYRTIYDRTSLDHPGALAAMERLIQAGQQARLLSEVPVKLYLADDRLALLPLAGYDSAVVVHPSALLDALGKLFDALWQRALPPHTPTSRAASRAGRRQPVRLANEQQRLITLLLSGLTDEAIARQLGVGYRTVQRRVADLMDSLGAHSRFQAGAQAALTSTRPPATGRRPSSDGAR